MVQVNTPHNSLNAIVLLFTDDSKNSEKYVHPNLESVDANIEDVLNSLHSGRSGSLTKNSMYKHARGFFLNGVNHVVKPTEYFGRDNAETIVRRRDCYVR